MGSMTSRAIDDLHLAIRHGNIDHAKHLIRVNPELAFQRIDEHGYTGMHLICEVGDGPTVKALFDVVEPEAVCSLRDNERRTPLHIAAEKGKEDVLRELVTASPNSILELNSLAETPLHVALKNDHCRCFLVLMERLQKLHFSWTELLLNQKDFEGNTVFHIAILRQQIQVMKVLLSHKFHEARESVTGRIIEKLMQEWTNFKICVLLVMFIFIANAAYESLFDLRDIYPLDQHHAANLTLSVRDLIRSPDLVPEVFYVVMFNTITFLGSMVAVLGIANTWSMAAKCSLCYRAVPLMVTGAMLITYGLAAKKIMPEFWLAIGPLKIPGFLAIWLFDLTLFFSTLAAWLIGKQIF